MATKERDINLFTDYGFKNESVVLNEIDKVYRKIGLFKEYDNGKRIIRAGGRI